MAAIRAQTQTQIRLALPVLNGEKSSSITSEQWIQRVENAKHAG